MPGNEYIVEKRRTVGRLESYDGVCEKCGSPVNISEPILVIEIYKDEKNALLVPADLLRCPHCGVYVEVMRLWLSLNVTSELKTKTESENT